MTPLRILAKDDCFSFYLWQALERVGQSCVLACYDEKVPSDILLDALAGLHADPAIVEPWLANPYCFSKQKALNCLRITNADMIIIGSFSDLTIRRYRHRERGWCFFEMRHCIQDTTAVDAACERLALLPVDKIVANNLALFAHFQKRNPQARAMWINYPYLDGVPTEWDDAQNPISNQVVKSRCEELTTATTDTFPAHNIFVLNIPREQVRCRDRLLWHYHNSTYDWAAQAVLAWLAQSSG